ncbi:MAG: DUF1206 domain-containing protein [Synechococcales bacterium]|nr:DUF1206 domain-containing protein [Synechococcales bacterium]
MLGWLKQIPRLLLKCFKWKAVQYWIRFGYASKGIVYFSIGFLSLRAALGQPVAIVGTEGALLTLLRQPLGEIIVTILAVGLCGYSFWRFIQAISDPEHERGLSLQSVGQRVGYLISGMVYVQVAYESVDFALDPSPIQTDVVNRAMLRVLGFKYGEALIVLVALVTFGIGAIYVYGAISGKFISQFKRTCRVFSQSQYRWLRKMATYLAQIGYTARGVAILVIGVGYVRAALTSSVAPAGGMEEALKQLLQRSYGTEGLLMIALGFIAYSLYMIFNAFYRRFQVD